MNFIVEEASEIDKIPMKLLLLADPSEELINKYLPQGIKLVTKHQNIIIGVLVLLRTRPQTMEIINLSVDQEYQNKGIGRGLITKAIERAKQENVKTLEIGTGNPGAIQMLLYQKCGFRIVGVDFDYFRNHYKEKIIENGIECRDMIRMRRDL